MAKPNTPTISLKWSEHNSYESARIEKHVIYLFEWNKKPFYWGIADRSAFGTRYNAGYRHLIEGALQNGGKLFLASVTNRPTSMTLVTIENCLIVRYGHTMNKRINLNTEELIITHKGNRPACIEHKIDQTQTPDQSEICNRIREGQTIARGNQFYFSTTDEYLYIYRTPDGNSTHRISIGNLLDILDNIYEKYKNDSFILDNKADPINAPERGFGGLICRVLETYRAYAPVASYLGPIFCSAGILEHFRVRGMRNNPINFRLILRPESPADLLTLIDDIPD